MSRFYLGHLGLPLCFFPFWYSPLPVTGYGCLCLKSLGLSANPNRSVSICFHPTTLGACWVSLACIHAALNTLFEIVYYKRYIGKFAVTKKENKCKTLASCLCSQLNETSNHKTFAFWNRIKMTPLPYPLFPLCLVLPFPILSFFSLCNCNPIHSSAFLYACLVFKVSKYSVDVKYFLL